jgi:hypothetical protein
LHCCRFIQSWRWVVATVAATALRQHHTQRHCHDNHHDDDCHQDSPLGIITEKIGLGNVNDDILGFKLPRFSHSTKGPVHGNVAVVAAAVLIACCHFSDKVHH